jgi:uracil-DNA glycosylase
MDRSATLPVDALLADLTRCRLCRDAPRFGAPLPHEPRPIFQIAPTARLLIASQAPGTRAHASGRPFKDPSGVRLRAWMGVDEATFYDASRIAIAPMGHCFPGLDANGGDLPPRRECAPRWRGPVLELLPHLSLILVIGQYARDWHLPAWKGRGLTETVAAWREIGDDGNAPRILPLPHPSWRNNGWLKRNPWFEEEMLPQVRRAVAGVVGSTSGLGS